MDAHAQALKDASKKLRKHERRLLVRAASPIAGTLGTPITAGLLQNYFAKVATRRTVSTLIRAGLLFVRLGTRVDLRGRIRWDARLWEAQDACVRWCMASGG